MSEMSKYEQQLIDEEQLQAEYDECRETGEADLCGECNELTDMYILDMNCGLCNNCMNKG